MARNRHWRSLLDQSKPEKYTQTNLHCTTEWRELEFSQSQEIKDKSARTLIVIQALKLTIMIVYIYAIEKIPSWFSKWV